MSTPNPKALEAAYDATIPIIDKLDATDDVDLQRISAGYQKLADQLECLERARDPNLYDDEEADEEVDEEEED